MRTTHTYALLRISPAAYNEIAGTLREAGYDHAFIRKSNGDVHIDMQGIALALDYRVAQRPLVTDLLVSELLVRSRRDTQDLDRVIQSLGAVVGQDPAGEYLLEDGLCVVRCLGDPE